MKKSAIWHGCIRAQGVVNGRYVAEVARDVDHHAGTLVCDRAHPDDGDDITFTHAGVRYMDEGQFTERLI